MYGKQNIILLINFIEVILLYLSEYVNGTDIWFQSLYGEARVANYTKVIFSKRPSKVKEN